MSEREQPSILAIMARFCVALSIVLLSIMISIKGCQIRDLQRRVGQLESERRRATSPNASSPK